MCEQTELFVSDSVSLWLSIMGTGSYSDKRYSDSFYFRYNNKKKNVGIETVGIALVGIGTASCP